MAALRTQLLLPHHARPLADILLKFISTNRAGPHGTSVLPVTLLAVIEQVQTARLSCLPLVFLCVDAGVFRQTLSLLAPLAARAAAAEGEDFVVVEDVEEVMAMP